TALFIRARQPREADDVGGEDCCELPGFDHGAPPLPAQMRRLRGLRVSLVQIRKMNRRQVCGFHRSLPWVAPSLLKRNALARSTEERHTVSVAPAPAPP